jgi:GNAT superfamily N-acetyltransferase
MDDIEVIDTDANNIHNYGFCGYKNITQEGYKRKLDWLKERFPEGMKFKVMYSVSDGAVGFIEYIPGEYAWRAVEASGYMVIHCILNIYRKNRGKGYGTLLLEECLRDAQKENMHGVAVVARKGTWMAGKQLFLKNGFGVVDTALPDFELLVKKFADMPPPKFTGDWEKRLSQYSSGLTIIRSDQCPYVAKSVEEISETAEKKYGIKPRIIELKNCEETRSTPSPYGIFSIVHNEKLLADHPISNKRFMSIMDKRVQRHRAKL